MLQSMGSQRVGHNLITKQQQHNNTDLPKGESSGSQPELSVMKEIFYTHAVQYGSH